MKTDFSPHHLVSPGSQTSLTSNPAHKNSGYPGSKAQAGVFHTIIGQMPPHDVYMEAFVGSGQVFKRKRRALVTHLYDLNPAVIGTFEGATGVHAQVADALKVLPTAAKWLPADAVVYCDPPYLLETRGKPGRIYYGEFEFAQRVEEDRPWHTALLAILQAMPCRVLLSGYPSELYSSQLRKWRCIEYTMRTRGRTLTECLWCNFPEPEQLHDWNFAGKNYRQRDSMKRQAERWLNKLEAMPLRQRGYLLHLISQRHLCREDPKSIGGNDVAVRNGNSDEWICQVPCECNGHANVPFHRIGCPFAQP